MMAGISTTHGTGAVVARAETGSGPPCCVTLHKDLTALSPMPSHLERDGGRTILPLWSPWEG